MGEGLTTTPYSTGDLCALLDGDLDGDKQLDSAMQRVSGMLMRKLDENSAARRSGTMWRT